jgi:hypothetical protein
MTITAADHAPGSPAVAPPPVMVYTAGEAATILKCTASWLKEQARQRKIPFSMIGGSYHFSAEHLKAIVDLLEVSAASTPARSPRAPSRRPAAATTPAPVPGADVVVLRARQPRPRQRVS